jgi:phage shock protein PspC (stress-responsive transcriptional regulator)
MMNKVVSVEIARQMFWMDEPAFETLQQYLETLRSQLRTHESAEEIVADIELRVAELLYTSAGDGRRAISAARLDEVIAQIGYIDEDERDVEIPRKTYRDLHNRLLAGVCAGLATRTGISALILRLLFLALTALFGVGAVLYLILWIALDPSDNRNAALASQGKAQTASRIAASEAPRIEPLRAMQRILFLPVSLLGSLIGIVMRHVRAHRRGYSAIGRNLLALPVFGGGLFIGYLVLRFSASRLYDWPLTALLAASVLYLLILGTALFLRHIYLSRPSFEIRRSLMIAALVPIAALVAAGIHINLAHSEQAGTSIEKSFALEGSRLTLDFAAPEPSRAFTRPVEFSIRSGDAKPGTITLRIEYFADGSDANDATRNIRSIDYAFAFEHDTLHLDRKWMLHDDALRRGQAVHVTVVVPANIVIDSALPLNVDRDANPLRYKPMIAGAGPLTYLSDGRFLDQSGPARTDLLDGNERALLEQSFCESYFLSESWRCSSNLQQPVATNPRFDRSLLRDADTIEQLRQLLLQRPEILAHALAMIRELAESATVADPARDPLRNYIRHLLDTRATPETVPPQNSE